MIDVTNQYNPRTTEYDTGVEETGNIAYVVHEHLPTYLQNFYAFALVLRINATISLLKLALFETT